MFSKRGIHASVQYIWHLYIGLMRKVNAYPDAFPNGFFNKYLYYLKNKGHSLVSDKTTPLSYYCDNLRYRYAIGWLGRKNLSFLQKWKTIAKFLVYW